MEKVYLVVNLYTDDIGASSCDIETFSNIKSARKYFIDLTATMEKKLLENNDKISGFYRDTDSFQVSIESSPECYEIYITEREIKE